MGYYIRALASKKKHPQWKVQFISYKKSDTENSQAQKLIIHVKIEPTEWFCSQHMIYDYFYDQKFSLSYTNKILSILNLWGFFVCKKIDAPFLPVHRLRGYERQRLVDNYYQHNGSKKGESKPLALEVLKQAEGKMKTKQFNWLFIALWLGLRPQEIDNLKDPNLWKPEELPTGTKILWVFQTKIVALPPIDRWKPIPLIYDEQINAFQMIEAKYFERPLVKTVKKHFGPDISLYGGRKGFTDLMLEKKHSLESISQWMGHSTIGRTWRSYKDRQGVKFSLP